MSILIWLFISMGLIVWTIINWKHELQYIQHSWQIGDVKGVLRGCTNFALDTLITGSATAILGLTGLYAAGLAIFFSNMISVIFFAPPKEFRQSLKHS